MSNKLSSIFAFAIGAAIGSVVTWKLVKTKYEQIAQEEIDSVKEVFSRRAAMHLVNDETEKEPRRQHIEDKPDLSEYVALLKKEKYLAENPEGKEDVTASGFEPYVISPNEFGDIDGYETTSLTYYADNILADEFDEVIDDIDETVGLESLGHFGEYEDDSVFVRNDVRKTDYEILLDLRNYSDIPHTPLHPVDDDE